MKFVRPLIGLTVTAVAAAVMLPAAQAATPEPTPSIEAMIADPALAEKHLSRLTPDQQKALGDRLISTIQQTLTETPTTIKRDTVQAARFQAMVAKKRVCVDGGFEGEWKKGIFELSEWIDVVWCGNGKGRISSIRIRSSGVKVYGFPGIETAHETDRTRIVGQYRTQGRAMARWKMWVKFTNVVSSASVCPQLRFRGWRPPMRPGYAPIIAHYKDNCSVA